MNVNCDQNIKTELNEHYTLRTRDGAIPKLNVVMFSTFRNLSDLVNCAIFYSDRLRSFYVHGTELVHC
jgi:hypothetical protein